MSKMKNLTLLLLIACGLSSCTPKKVEKEIGIQLYSVRDDMGKDIPGTIASLGETGYKFVEAAGYGNGKFYGMDPAEFKALLNEHGMTMKSSHTGPNLPEEGKWEENMKWWDTCIAAHKAVGAGYIVKPSMGGDAYRSLDTLKMYCDYFNAIGEKCSKAGIRFGYHNHHLEFTTVLDGNIFYDFLLQNTDPDKVMFELDVYWIHIGGKEAVDYFNKYPGRFELYHVKDETELGASGQIDFKTIFDHAETAGMKEYIVEVERYNFEPLVSVAKSYEYLNNAEFVTK